MCQDEYGDGVRHSKAADAEIVQDPEERAIREAANALVQTEAVRQYALEAIDGGRGFKLRPSRVLDLNRCAIEGLDPYAGNWRPGPVEISKSKHIPPDAHLVPERVEELCDYVNDQWADATAIHLCAIVMWRLNWIHPFRDGNGRTSRAAAYLVLCAHSEAWLPSLEGSTITDQILDHRKPYYDALESADAEYERQGTLGQSVTAAMEDMIEGMLARQLTTYFKSASGNGH